MAEIIANTDAMIARTSPQIDRIAKNVEGVTAKMGPTVENVNATVTTERYHHLVLRDHVSDLVSYKTDTHEVLQLMPTWKRSLSISINTAGKCPHGHRPPRNDFTESVDERPWSLIRIRQPQDRTVPKKDESK